MTPRIMTALCGALILSVPTVSATATSSKTPVGPKNGEFTCSATDVAAVDSPVAGDLSFLKGNRYVFADGETAKFVYQTGRDRVRFKNGDLAPYVGLYDRTTGVLTLASVEDDSVVGDCVRVVVVEEPPAPPTEG